MNLQFDSNILIHALNGALGDAAASLFASSDPPFISVITWVEVLAGARDRNEQATRVFLSLCEVYPVTPEIAERTAHFRRTTRLKLPDAIIYATALETGRILVTLNTRDFPPGTDSVLIPNGG